MPADVWEELREAMADLDATIADLKRPLESEDAETPFERLRRLHGEMMNRDKPRPTLTLIHGGRDDA